MLAIHAVSVAGSVVFVGRTCQPKCEKKVSFSKMECMHRRLLLTIQTAASLFNCFERTNNPFLQSFFTLKNVKIFSKNVILSASFIDRPLSMISWNDVEANFFGTDIFETYRARQDSNLQSSDPKSDALSVTPRALLFA
ncbi:hypothetical protein T07_5135 [Trichinella nelsoni]|uniref:Uncharacterized protein n=1 Tax=Trichinella nelsoni TaxID=6336 RepID=A0A0V0RKZ6_9BILA|nr:hypothetical protein T07_5135 [Trichinella nelsoni]